ncbi:conserved exported hypothetical protein [uncultured Desulfobacterium sp.]|uniref:Uncharacterized protein n=1 Tax=uncultured Desulfobacterium sp. TaxID=201089 RepID=A0A445N316_9BACT|nr:conserved exported hypothetical protein [uncultured Desulfobacterium sp.]
MMTNFRMSILLVLILMLSLIIQSCAGVKTWILPKRSINTSAPVTPTSNKSTQASAKTANPTKKDSFKKSHPVKPTSQKSNQASANAANLAKKHMEAGEYQKAIDVYNVECRKHPHDQSLLREYVQAIEDIKLVADKALDKEQFVSAGRNYNLLLKNYPHFNGFDKDLSFKSIHLNEKLCYCKKAISKQGFQEYRKGNLNMAIVLWEDLLAIDPHNTDIKASLRTAKLQQKNLEEKE